MVKFRLYFDKDAEIKWLNKMSREGYAMTGFFLGFYSFDECEKGKYEYQVDFGNRFGGVSNEYREFMKESDIEIVQTWGFWIILRRLSSDKPFELYTDVDSALEQYKKIRNMFRGVTIFEVICALIEGIAGVNGFPLGYAFMFLFLALIMAFTNTIAKLNERIADLQEKKTGIQPKYIRRTFSPLMPIGVLINSCALILEDTVSTPVRHAIQLVAIAFLLVGLYKTVVKTEDEQGKE